MAGTKFLLRASDTNYWLLINKYILHNYQWLHSLVRRAPHQYCAGTVVTTCKLFILFFFFFFPTIFVGRGGACSSVIVQENED